MERLKQDRSHGISSNAVRTWGMLFVAAGVVGRGIIQNYLLHMNEISSQQLLEAMESSNAVMILATVSIVMQALETCAIPVFCFLLVEGFRHTGNFKKYFLRVLAVALLSEIPYNLLFGGKVLDMSGRNPAFGPVLCLVLLYFYRRYEEKKLGNTLIKALITLAALVWSGMLGIVFGVCCVLVTAALWACRKQPNFRAFAGCAAAAVCTLLSPYYLAAPMGFMAVHFYSGEKGPENRAVNYLAYPVLLLGAALAGKFLL